MYAPNVIKGYEFRGKQYSPIGIVAAVALFVEGSYLAMDKCSSVETFLDLVAENIGIDREDEESFDSENFPKVIFLA